MKKLLLILSLMAISTTCFAIVNFTSSTGTLVMRDVSVDGSTVYDSVTLQLNLANGTFTILDATLKDISFSDTVLDSLTENGLKVDFYGCALSGKNQITCMTKVVAISKDMKMVVWGDGRSKLFDNLSNQNYASTVTALDKTGSAAVDIVLIQGIPVEVKFIYNNINPAATSISAFQPEFMITVDFIVNSVIGNFRDINF